MAKDTKSLKPIMFVGTCSDAGKSILATAFCRILVQDGYNPAPFKAQNMSLNSYISKEGGELGRAQAVQAEACRLEPHTDMNPVLLKPFGKNRSQIILQGKAIANCEAKDYFKDDKIELFRAAQESFTRLRQKYNPIVLEGAGSISEVNLRDRDITNMRMAEFAGASTYLVADIDRGGVFASVYGSIMLLPKNHRQLIKGVIINKFRGDSSLFEEGKQIIKKLTGVPVVGIIPYYKDIHIEEEDSLALDKKPTNAHGDGIKTAVIKTKYLSNFTDFDCLEHDERFSVFYPEQPNALEQADIIILPGSKNTISDLLYIKEKGFDKAIKNAKKLGTTIIGICGGYQIMGQTISDPLGVEGEIRTEEGLAMLPISTILGKEKQTRQRTFKLYDQGVSKCYGYEIHAGETSVDYSLSSPVVQLENEMPEGSLISEKCWGTYMHGILDNPEVRDRIAAKFGAMKGKHQAYNPEDLYNSRQKEYDKLADWVRKHLDIDAIYTEISDTK